MDSISLLVKQIELAHLFLEGTMADVTPEQAHWQPGGRAAPVGANYAHIVTVEDRYISAAKGQRPVAETSYQGKTGASEPQPRSIGWDDWAKRVKMDLPALRAYGQAVYRDTDEFVKSLLPDDLNREIDLEAVRSGKQSLAWILTVICITHASMHHGEISCVKGLQGAKGYPI